MSIERDELLDQIESCKNEIGRLTNQQQELQTELNGWEVDEDDLADSYNDLLDELYGDVEVCGMHFSSRRVLEELDPTAYRCGMLDYLDSLEKDRGAVHHPLWQSYRELEEELEDVEADLETQQDTLEQLEDELSDLYEQEDDQA